MTLSHPDVPGALQPAAIARATGEAIARKARRGPSRQALLRQQLREAGLAPYAAELSIRRGKCFKCRGRFSVVRVTFDYTSAKAIGSFAHVECARCHHVWYRTSVPKLGEYQSVRLTLILPSVQQRWFARGRWHVEGEDAIVLKDATWPDLMDAGADWRKRNTRYESAIARRKAAKAAKDAEAVARARDLWAAIDARRAAEAEAEREAAAREAAGQS